jgi:hypothetical protein
MVGVKLSKKNILILSLVAWYVICMIAYVLFTILVDYDIGDRIENALVVGVFFIIAVVGQIYIEKRMHKS